MSFSYKKRGVAALHRDSLPLDWESDFFAERSQEIALGHRGEAIFSRLSPKKGDRSWLSSRIAWEVEDSDDIGVKLASDSEYWATLEGDVYPDGASFPEYAIQDEQEKDELQKKKLEKNKRTLRARRPHEYWRQYCQSEFLDELVRHDGRADALRQAGCWECLQKGVSEPPEGLYRCQQCYLGELLCQTCCVSRHRKNPFHKIERWTKCSFEIVSLKSLGLQIQLNHFSMRCTNPKRCNKRLRVLHFGVHEAEILFCGCMSSLSIPQHIQLLRRGLYPSTTGTGRITTVATFEFLEFCHHITLATKASAYDLYRALSRATDNTGTTEVAWRYRAFMRMLVQWQHLKLLKRSGRGHDPSGVAGTKEGELVVPCPSCPHPGINLPPQWSNETDKPFLYSLRIAMDANFRLKEQLVSNHWSDPGLSDGGGYFVGRVPYEKYVLSRASEEDISRCIGFAAMAKALTKFSTGQRYTGVGAAACARGEMFLPNGVGNLQRGERFANMDYIYGSALKHFAPIREVIVGYDIACQWIIHLNDRMEQHWPERLIPPSSMKAVPVIGKFHFPVHEDEEHEQFNCNLTLGVGLTDHEVLERLWGIHNQLGNSTKTMGPGTRIAALESHFGVHNWEKYKNMGKSLWGSYKSALVDRNRQKEGHRTFSEGLPTELVDRWEQLCKDWEAASYPKSGVMNPFEIKEKHMTEKEVEKELAAEDEVRARERRPVRNNTSAAKFVMLGLDLEEAQFKHVAELKEYGNSMKTSRQTTSILDRRTILFRNIRSYEELRSVYMPGLLQYLKDHGEPTVHEEEEEESRPELVALWMPSSLPTETRTSACEDGVAEIELRLRIARCHDALHSMRHLLRVKSRMLLFKNANVRGQRESGKSREVIDRIHARIKDTAEKYRRNRERGMALAGGSGEWDPVLQPLEISDVRSYIEPARIKKGSGRKGILEREQRELMADNGEERERGVEDMVAEDLFEAERTREQGTGETRKTISWIWLNQKIQLEDGADENDNEILRSEWCRSRARAQRSSEEVDLLREEMRRTGVFLTWKAAWWDGQVSRRDVDAHLGEGLQAYALKQARIQRGLAHKFARIWSGSLDLTEQESEEERAGRTGLGLDEMDVGHEEDIDAEEGDDEQGNDRGDVVRPDRETEPGEDEADEAEAVA